MLSASFSTASGVYDLSKMQHSNLMLSLHAHSLHWTCLMLATTATSNCTPCAQSVFVDGYQKVTRAYIALGCFMASKAYYMTFS